MIDLTTTEVADMLVGGVFPCDGDRFGAAIRTGLPYVASVGAMDMVNFGPRDTVPEKFRNRRFVIHNANVTLMRTTPDENRAIGEWFGERLNRMEGPVRLMLPEGGVSALDAPGKPFRDPEADAALFDALERRFARRREGVSSASRRTSTTMLSSRRWRGVPRRRTAPRAESLMPRLERKAILGKLQAMKDARRPIIGGGAGTGLSAKCEEAGGIDLIVIYNSGRYRMAGRGSLAGMHRLWQRQRDRRRNGA